METFERPYFASESSGSEDRLKAIVAGLSRGKLVNFTAFVADVQRIPVRNPANGVVREFKTLIARCNF